MKKKIRSKTGFLLVAFMFSGAIGVILPAPAQITPRLIKDQVGQTGAEKLEELVRKGQSLYNLKPSFEGVTEAEFVKTGAAPPMLLKWGQLKNPVGEGFLTLSAATLDPKFPNGALEVWVPLVSFQSCGALLSELSAMPEVSDLQIGKKMPRIANGTMLTAKQLEEVCTIMSKDGIRLVSPMSKLGSLSLEERKVKKLDTNKPLFDQ